jgi:hypothetical protein
MKYPEGMEENVVVRLGCPRLDRDQRAWPPYKRSLFNLRERKRGYVFHGWPNEWIRKEGEK